ncbi:hypothetical protein LRS06_07715 [Hymenobacter sp. J193]|uniref:hypothetical protein n=1 Tax=Hymenobacter sp. J193 TaxID=2898429 RepID=UPI002150966A|nr:hypothetical protein [Hymenobacter sp. J193]MCR5887666.1 hypothetical protein [Hymenobacter sp. J193]
MPELSNIQTYEKINNSNFEPTLNRFANVLKNIGLWNTEIKTDFDSVKWEVEDNRFIYSSVAELGYFTSNLSSIKIRPLFTIYTPAIDDTFNENWIGCEFLIEANEIRSYKNGKLHAYAYDLVRALVFEMHKEFKQTGVYFTDEAQDGGDFDGVRCNVPEKLWQFDYALIPSSLEKLYSKKPYRHSIKHHESYFEAWYIERWKEKQ